MMGAGAAASRASAGVAQASTMIVVMTGARVSRIDFPLSAPAGSSRYIQPYIAIAA
jgi:hypothetical protein